MTLISKFTLLVATAIICAHSSAWAVPAKQIVRPQKLGSYIAAGAIVGGSAGKIFSLIRVQKMLLAGGVERLILTYGDQDGVPLKSQPGYFHLNLDQAGQRLVLDLSQVLKTAIDQQDLIKELKGSRLVSRTDMSMDPQDGTTNITLYMRAPVEMKAQIEATEERQNQLVIDMRPVSKH